MIRQHLKKYKEKFHTLKNKKKWNYPQFPSIYRSITEKLNFKVKISDFSRSSRFVIWFIQYWERVLASFVALVIFFGLIVVVSDLYKNLEQKQLLEQEHKKTVLEIQFWERVVREYPIYRDGYFQLAVLEYKLKDIVQTKKYLEKVFQLDPNFEKARELEILIKQS